MKRGVFLLLLILQPGILWSTQRSSEFSPKVYHEWNPDFLFPDQLPRVKKQLSISNTAVIKLNKNRFVPSPCDNGEDFCEFASDYPDTAILQQIRDQSTSSELEILRSIQEQTSENEVRDANTVSRLRPGVADVITSVNSFTLQSSPPVGGSYSYNSGVMSKTTESAYDIEEEEYTPVCRSKTTYLKPRVARNLNREWRYVANDDILLTQPVKVEKCLSKDSSCDVSEPGTRCQQRYSVKKMLTLHPETGQILNPNTGKPNFEDFLLPSCCICMKKTAGHDYNSFELFSRSPDNTFTIGGRTKQQQREEEEVMIKDEGTFTHSQGLLEARQEDEVQVVYPHSVTHDFQQPLPEADPDAAAGPADDGEDDSWQHQQQRQTLSLSMPGGRQRRRRLDGGDRRRQRQRHAGRFRHGRGGPPS